MAVRLGPVEYLCMSMGFVEDKLRLELESLGASVVNLDGLTDPSHLVELRNRIQALDAEAAKALKQLDEMTVRMRGMTRELSGLYDRVADHTAHLLPESQGGSTGEILNSRPPGSFISLAAVRKPTPTGKGIGSSNNSPSVGTSDIETAVFLISPGTSGEDNEAPAVSSGQEPLDEEIDSISSWEMSDSVETVPREELLV